MSIPSIGTRVRSTSMDEEGVVCAPCESVNVRSAEALGIVPVKLDSCDPDDVDDQYLIGLDDLQIL